MVDVIKLEVGHTLWIVKGDQDNGKAVKVAAVGRTLVTLKSGDGAEYKLERFTGKVRSDRGDRPEIYESQQAFDKQRSLGRRKARALRKLDGMGALSERTVIALEALAGIAGPK